MIDIEVAKILNRIISNNQQGGGGYIQINHLSEKLVKQYEQQIKNLQEQNTKLMKLLAKK